LDQYLGVWSDQLGPWLYVLVFLIVFAETGLIVTPFLPGDSLLFALGAMTTLSTGALDYTLLSVGLIVAVFLGDNLNYRVGRWIGPQVFRRENSIFFKKSNLEKTHQFCEKYGSLSVVLARFLPIVRTFVPFVVGVGRMDYRKFLAFSFFGSICWIQIFLGLGHYFGNLPSVKKNFPILILGIIVLSVAPTGLAILKNYLQRRRAQS
jgi:membrane-associated protein